MCWRNSRKANHKTAKECKRKYNPQTRTHIKEKKMIKYVRLDSIHNIKTVKLKDDNFFLQTSKVQLHSIY